MTSELENAQQTVFEMRRNEINRIISNNLKIMCRNKGWSMNVTDAIIIYLVDEKVWR